MEDKFCYFNGKYMKESEVRIPIWDLGVMYGWGVFEVCRSFNHVPFKMKQHVARLSRSLNYVQIDPKLTPEELHDIGLEVFKRNEVYLAPNCDYWIVWRITVGGAGPCLAEPAEPTVLVNCMDIPHKKMAKNYTDGHHLVVAQPRTWPVQCLDPKVKASNKWPHRLAELEAQKVDPGALPLMLDLRGYVAEGAAQNIFMVKGGRLFTPKPDGVLYGISRETVLELAKELGIECTETDITVYDLYNADEILLTWTSRSISPVSKLNNRPLKGPIPGPITQKLISAWSKRVGIDIVEQCISQL